MSEVLAQLKQKGGGGSAELLEFSFSASSSGTLDLSPYADYDEIIVIFPTMWQPSFTPSNVTIVNNHQYNYENRKTQIYTLKDITSVSRITYSSGGTTGTGYIYTYA